MFTQFKSLYNGRVYARPLVASFHALMNLETTESQINFIHELLCACALYFILCSFVWRCDISNGCADVANDISLTSLYLMQIFKVSGLF